MSNAFVALVSGCKMYRVVDAYKFDLSVKVRDPYTTDYSLGIATGYETPDRQEYLCVRKIIVHARSSASPQWLFGMRASLPQIARAGPRMRCTEPRNRGCALC